MLKLELLGPPILTVDGRPIVVDTRKAIALLAYLGVSGQPHRREALAALLWPDADTPRAAGALRRTLSAVRTAIGAQRLATDRATIALVLDDVEVDVATCRALLQSCTTHGHPAGDVCEKCVEPLSAVAALHRGTFLEGFALRDSAAYDDWQFFTAEESTRELSGVLEQLTTALVAQGRVADAIGAARRRLALDPLHEPAHRELIRLHAWNGEHSAALRQYRECVRVLERELGVPPLAETTAVYEEVLEHRLTPPAPTMPVPAADVEAAPATTAAPQTAPYVGRAAPTSEILAAVTHNADHGTLVVVEGEAGIGKTRLVAEVLGSPALSGRPTVTARCFEGEAGLAYGVMVEALRNAVEQQGTHWLRDLPAELAVEVSRLLPEVAQQRPDLPAPPSLDGPGARIRFVDALGRALAAAVETESGGIVVIEDLQWLDDASYEVLVHLARRIAGRRLALVLTWRTESVGRGHPLRRLAADARRDGYLTAVTLARLDPPAVAEALAGFGIDEPQVASRVSEETEGLPLLVVEFARALAEDPRSLDGSLPGGARDVLAARLDAVSDTATQVLTTAAVIGRSFELEVLTEASGRTDEEVTAALEELLSRNLVVEVADTADRRAVSYDFTHAHLRRLAYDQAALARRRLLHRRVAAAIENRARRGAGDALAGVIATHWAAAGDDPRAAEWEARAGAHAAALLAVPEAIAHYRTALALGHADVEGLHERLGDLQTLQGRYAEALASYESAAAVAEPGVAALEHKLGVVHHRNGRWDMADRHYEAALQALADTDQVRLRSRITADRGLNAFRRGDLEDAQILAERAATTAAADGDPASEAQAANLLGLLARARGDLDAAQAQLRRSLELARGLGDAAAETSALNNLALALGASGDTEEALRLAGAALARSAEVGDRHREAALHNNIADLHRTQGSADEAMAHLKKAVAIFAEVGEPGVLSPEVWKLVDW